jgi:hypothetical protein
MPFLKWYDMSSCELDDQDVEESSREEKRLRWVDEQAIRHFVDICYVTLCVTLSFILM